MAPRSTRRPGFSRRAQYSIFATYVIAALGAVIALLMVLSARLDPEGHFSPLQALASDITAPISKAGRGFLGNMGAAGMEVSAYFNAASKNQILRQELAAARRKAVQADFLLLENKRLKSLLGLSQKSAAPVAVAPLVSSTGASSRRYATLAAGQDDGVRNGQPVIGPEGLVGRIVAIGRSSARVLLIVDAASVTPVKRLSDGAPALAMGRGDGKLTLRALTSGQSPFKKGDMFVTSGSGGIYRPGIPVAQAVEDGRDGATARPTADPDSFDFALVEPIYQAEPPAARADMLLEDKP